MISVYSFDSTSIPLWCYVLMFLVNIGVFLYWTSFNKADHHQLVRFKDYIVAILFILFAIFYCLVDDYFAYRSWVEDGYSIYYDKEIVYTFLVDFVNNLNIKYKYELFRLIIWGTSIVFFFVSSRLLKASPLFSLLFLFLLFYNIFSYARGSLGMSIYILGISFLINGQMTLKRITLYIVGVLLIFSSVVFHRQMLIAVAITPFLFLGVDKKKSMILAIPLVLFIAIIYNFAIEKIGLLNEGIRDNIDLYSNSISAGITINRFIEYSLFYIAFYMVYRQLPIIKRNTNSTQIVYLYRITYGIMVMATAFLLILSNDNTIFYRTLYMSMIPLSILLSYCYVYGSLKKRSLNILFLYAMFYHAIYLIVLLR